MIEEAIVEADKKGTKVLTLGLFNQGDEMNKNGELFIKRNPQLKLKLVDGSSLAAAVVLNSIPEGTTHVAIKGKSSKVSNSVAIALCHRGVQVSISNENAYRILKEKCDSEIQDNLILSESYSQKVIFKLLPKVSFTSRHEEYKQIQVELQDMKLGQSLHGLQLQQRRIQANAGRTKGITGAEKANGRDEEPTCYRV